MDAVELKRRYQSKWARANARERLVLAILENYLPPGFEAHLTGLGAGSSVFIGRGYEGEGEAFDITVYYGPTPVAYVEVTGVEDRASMRAHRCPGKCIGSWKLEKARRHGAVRRTWFAYVVDEDASVYWLPAAWLEHYTEAPFVSKCNLYGDERIVYCIPPGYWKRFKHFRQWLVNTAVYLARLTPRG